MSIFVELFKKHGTMENQSLFNDFETTSLSDWKSKIIKDLKGKDFDETLVWEDDNGIKHQPIYNEESIAKNELIKAIQAAQKKSKNWGNVQLFDANDKDSLHQVTDSLKEGLDFAFVENATDYKSFIASKPEGKKIYFFLNKIDTTHLPKRYLVDPIKETLQKTENAAHNMAVLKDLFQVRLNDLKPDHFLMVDGSIYKESGATIIEELAYTLSHAVEYFDKMTEEGFTTDAVARSFIFKLGYGNSYFAEIAKGRAFHYLVEQLYQQYNTKQKVVVWGEASSYYQSHKDPYTNLLRLSSQAMSAVLGNCSLVSLPTYDGLEKSSSLGRRMSKNIPLILKEESSFEQVRDTASGSYYIESLSAEIASKAWELFLKIEKKGGLLHYFEKGKLAEKLEESHNNRLEKYLSKERTFLGVNKFENPKATDLNIKASNSKGIVSRVLSKEVNA